MDATKTADEPGLMDFIDGPDHTQLPDSDGKPVESFEEHPQSEILSTSLRPVLRGLHPNGDFVIASNSGIYWRITQPPLDGCKAPDWYYVPGVPRLLDGVRRRSYVQYRERRAPRLVVEYVSGDGSEERDDTPHTGKFWVYERGIQAEFYAIYEVDPGRVELYALRNGRYQPVPANNRGHYPIAPLGIELGIWQGVFDNADLPWLRVWDAQGNLIPHGEERAETAEERAESAEERAESAEERAETAEVRAETAEAALANERARAEAERERLRERLRQAGIDPDAP